MDIKIQKLIKYLLDANEQVIMIDYGKSSRDSCESLGGKLIEFNPQSNICLNPFSVINEEEFELDSDYRQGISMLIFLILGRMCDLRDAETIIEEAIEAVWNQYRGESTITNVAEFLLEQKDRRAKDLGTKLEPFTTSGAYSRFFEGRANLSLDAPYYVFEFNGFKDSPDLQQIIFMSAMLIVTESIVHGDKSDTTIFITEGDRVMIGFGLAPYLIAEKDEYIYEFPKSSPQSIEGGKQS